MRWQSVARAVVALIGVGCAVAVYIMLRPRPEGMPATAPEMLDDTATAASKGTTVKRLDATGRETFLTKADEMRVMADGRTLFKGLTLTFSRGGVKYSVTAGEAESSGKYGPTGEEPSKVVFSKTVTMKGDDGFSVDAEEATYVAEEQRVNFPGAVTFVRDRMSGQGVGGDLYMERSVFWTYADSRLDIAPHETGAPVAITAKGIGLAPNDDYLRAEGDARLTRDAQALSADAMLVYFTEDTQTVRRIELMGQSVVRRTGGGRRPDMRGNDIALDFAETSGRLAHARLDTSAVLTLREDSGTTRVSASVIDFSVGADGQTLTRLEATGPTEVLLPRDGKAPARTILSAGLIAEGTDPKGLDRAVFSGGIQYRETLPATRGQVAATRLATSASLVLNLGGALNQVTVAEFRQNFCFAGPMVASASAGDLQCAPARILPVRGTLPNTTAAAADEGRYDARAETLQLRSTTPSRPRPRVVNQDIEVTGQEIDVDITQDGIDARLRVESLRKPTAARAREATPAGLFESGKAISARANALKYSRATGIARYSGDVFMFQQGTAGQDGSVLKADEVTLDDQKQDLAAVGRVRSTFFIERAPDAQGKKGPTSTHLNGDQMTYTESTRTAVYAGAAKMESGEGNDKQGLEAAQITLEMQAQRRALKRLEGITSGPGPVIARLPEGRQATGLRLTYDAETDRYVVTGTPAQFVSRSATKGPDICEVGTGSELSFLRTEGLSNVKNEGGAVGRAGDRRCIEVLK